GPEVPPGQAPGRPPGARAGRRPGPVLLGPGTGTGSPGQHPQPAGGPAGARGPPGPGPRTPAGRLSRGPCPPLPGGAWPPGRRPAEGPDDRQREEPLGAGARQAPPLPGRRAMTTDGAPRPARAPSGPATASDDPRLARAIEDYLSAERAGERPGRDEFLA